GARPEEGGQGSGEEGQEEQAAQLQPAESPAAGGRARRTARTEAGRGARSPHPAAGAGRRNAPVASRVRGRASGPVRSQTAEEEKVGPNALAAGVAALCRSGPRKRPRHGLGACTTRVRLSGTIGW